MNTPNKLTLLRIILVPVFVLFMLWQSLPFANLCALAVFVAASLTDLIDGKLARKHNLVTDFGKFIDPLADKLLVTAALLCLRSHGYIGVVSVIIIISREFIVTSLRSIAAAKGRVVAADIFGKIKTVFQMIWIIFILLCLSLSYFLELAPMWQGISFVMRALEIISVALTVISGINYFWSCREYIDPSK